MYWVSEFDYWDPSSFVHQVDFSISPGYRLCQDQPIMRAHKFSCELLKVGLYGPL